MRDDSDLAWGRAGDEEKWRDSRHTWNSKAIGLDREGERGKSQEEHRRLGTT